MKKLSVEALKHRDVRNNELLYLRLKNEEEEKEVLINIGKKTYDSVKQLTETNEKTETNDKKQDKKNK